MGSTTEQQIKQAIETDPVYENWLNTPSADEKSYDWRETLRGVEQIGNSEEKLNLALNDGNPGELLVLRMHTSLLWPLCSLS